MPTIPAWRSMRLGALLECTRRATREKPPKILTTMSCSSRISKEVAEHERRARFRLRHRPGSAGGKNWQHFSGAVEG